MKLETNINVKDRTLLTSLIEELGRGLRVISSIDDLTYCRAANNSGSIGAQFRHILDFVSAVLKGIDTGRIDYSDRERDLRIELDRRYAARRFDSLINELRSKHFVPMKSTLVRSELDPGIWTRSSTAREIEFVHSHTVHHHALIAEKLASCGLQPGENFGVAPSTISYWAKVAA